MIWNGISSRLTDVTGLVVNTAVVTAQLVDAHTSAAIGSPLSMPSSDMLGDYRGLFSHTVTSLLVPGQQIYIRTTAVWSSGNSSISRSTSPSSLLHDLAHSPDVVVPSDGTPTVSVVGSTTAVPPSGWTPAVTPSGWTLIDWAPGGGRRASAARLG